MREALCLIDDQVVEPRAVFFGKFQCCQPHWLVFVAVQFGRTVEIGEHIADVTAGHPRRPPPPS